MSRSTRTSVTVIHDPDGLKQDRYHLEIPPRTVQVLWAGAILGTIIGFRRGVRTASLRFLAENAHNPPKTKQGWYFYKKTKNYRMLLQGFVDAGRWAGGLGLMGLGWVTAEELVDRSGWDEVKEVAAGLAVSSVFVLWRTCYFFLSSICVEMFETDRPPLIATRQILTLGLAGGVMARGLRWLQTWSDEQREKITSPEIEQSKDDVS